MEKHISYGLKITFLVHAIFGLLTGLVFLLYPQAWNALGAKIQEPEIYRVVGAAILGFAASSWWAYKEAAWEKVKIIVKMEIFWTALGALVILFGLLFAGLPAIEWVFAIVLAGFAVAFYYFFKKY